MLVVGLHGVFGGAGATSRLGLPVVEYSEYPSAAKEFRAAR